MLILVFAYGLCLGSFANVISWRLENCKKSVLKGRSHCPKCNHVLNAFDLVPLFSWLLLKGKCRYCQHKISWQYPAAELFFGFLALLCWFLFSSSWLLFIWGGVLFFALGAIVLSDLRYLDIPDAVSLPTIIFLLISSTAAIYLPELLIPNITEALLGVSIAYGFLFVLAAIPFARYYLQKQKWRKLLLLPLEYFYLPLSWFYYFFSSKQEPQDDKNIQQWLGGGDLRLGVIIGLVFGAKLGLTAILLGFASGSIISLPILILHGSKQKIAFGPFLILGMILVWLWGEQISTWYFQGII